MSHALAGGAPRMLRCHDGDAGRWYGEGYRALAERFGPFDALTRHHAAGAAMLWKEFRTAAKAIADAEERRSHGKGRRPSTAQIAALKKRLGLSWQSYETAVARLEVLAKRPAPKLRDYLDGQKHG